MKYEINILVKLEVLCFFVQVVYGCFVLPFHLEITMCNSYSIGTLIHQKRQLQSLAQFAVGIAIVKHVCV